MSIVEKRLAWLAGAAVAMSPLAASSQVFTDGDFNAVDYTTSGIGTIQDVRFNVDYSNIDIFGDGFITVNIPEAPNSSGGTATTGVFLTVNNDSIALGGTGVESFASVSPTLANLNVGAGTATENYVMQVDVFHSTGPGVDDGAGNLSFTGTTNYSYVGINQTNTTVRLQENNNGDTTGQGAALAITADTGAAEDYMPHYGGVGYRFRAGSGTFPNGVDYKTAQEEGFASTGLVSDAINAAWQGQANATGTFDFGTAVPETELNQFSGDSLYFSPDPLDPDGFLSDGSGVDRSYFAEAFPVHNDPLVITPNIAPAFAIDNDQAVAGVPYNRWATHKIYHIDGVMTYTITDSVLGTEVVVLEQDLSADAGLDTTSDAGTVVLGFWDRFGGSIALSPEGANFVVYDTLSVTAANPGDAPTLAAAIADFLPAGSAALVGDFDGSGQVGQTDLNAVLLNWGDAVAPAGFVEANLGDGGPFDGNMSQNELNDVLLNWGNTAEAGSGSVVPEPATAALLGLGGLALLRRRSA